MSKIRANEGSERGDLGTRVAVTLALMLGVSACTTAMHPVPAAIVTSGQTRSFPRALVITSTGYQRMLVNAELRSDSLLGTLADSSKGRFAIAVTDISRMESEERDPAPAVQAVAGFLGAVTGGLVRGMGEIMKCSFARC